MKRISLRPCAICGATGDRMVRLFIPGFVSSGFTVHTCRDCVRDNPEGLAGVRRKIVGELSHARELRDIHPRLFEVVVSAVQNQGVLPKV